MKAIGNLKRCSRCLTVKSTDDFGVSRNEPDGLNCRCLECCREVYRERNKEKWEETLERRKQFQDGYKWCHKCQDYKVLKDFSIARSRSDGLAVYCKQCYSTINKKWRLKTLDKEKQRLRDDNQKNKRIVMKHYGNTQCVCCGESNIKFLNIDHINNNGNKHRKKINGSMYWWLIKNNFPEGFQVLCYNCNLGRAHNVDNPGICPHQEVKNV